MQPSIREAHGAPDVPLPDQDASMVDTLRETGLEDLGLQPTLQEVLDLEGQHVIETHTRLVEHTDADEPTDEGVTLEETLGVFRVELEQLTGRTTNLGQDETDTPDLALVAQAVLAGELQLRIETRILEGATGDLVTVKSQQHGARLDQHGASLHIVDLEETMLTSCCGSSGPCMCPVNTTRRTMQTAETLPRHFS